MSLHPVKAALLTALTALPLTIPNTAHAGELFRFIRHEAKIGAVGATAMTGLGAITARGVLDIALTGCSSTSCGQQAVEHVMAFLAKHKHAGHAEMAHAMTKAAQNNPSQVGAIKDLASQAGVKVTLAGEGLPPPGDCEQDDCDGLVMNVQLACKPQELTPEEIAAGMTQDDKEHPLQVCKDDRTLSVTSRMGLWHKSLGGFGRCHDARERLMKQCFRGGDKGHQEQLSIVKNSIRKCQSLITKYRGK